MFGFTDKIIAYVAGAVALVLLATCLWLRTEIAFKNHTISGIEGDNKSLRVELGVAEAQTSALAKTVDDQNVAVDVMQQRTAASKAKVTEVLATLEASQKSSKVRIDQLTSRIKTSNEKTCAVAIREIRGMLR